MSSLQVVSGNIFRSEAQTLVNTINCVGVMGAGIALEFRLRYPEMFIRYQQLCEQKQIDIGKLWIYKTPERWVLNFPTKQHWRYPSKVEYLHAGLQKFMATYQERGVTSAAFPLLGAQMGGLSAEQSLEIMEGYLNRCDISIEIYRYDPQAPDDLYDLFKSAFLQLSTPEIKLRSGLRVQSIDALRRALEDEHICQLNQLARIDGVGDKTLEKAYRFVLAEVQEKDSLASVQGLLI